MKLSALLASVVLVVATAGYAAAQSRIQPPTLRPSDKPTTSPYLQLAPTSSAFGRGLNYFTRVRPDRRFLDANRSQEVENRRLNNSLNELRNRQTDQQAQLLMQTQTGHSATFFNTSGYFPSRRSR